MQLLLPCAKYHMHCTCCKQARKKSCKKVDNYWVRNSRNKEASRIHPRNDSRIRSHPPPFPSLLTNWILYTPLLDILSNRFIFYITILSSTVCWCDDMCRREIRRVFKTGLQVPRYMNSYDGAAYRSALCVTFSYSLENEWWRRERARTTCATTLFTMKQESVNNCTRNCRSLRSLAMRYVVTRKTVTSGRQSKC